MLLNNNSVQVIKSINPTLKQAMYVVLSPDEVDAHGDIYDENEVRDACHNFNAFCRRPNLKHLQNTESFTVAESYISPVDLVIGETFVKKGSWLTVLQFNSDTIWKGVVDGEFTGVSVGCKATGEYL